MFDRLPMLEFACFIDLNIAKWVKSTRANDPNDAGPSGSNRPGKRPSNYSEARTNRCARFFDLINGEE